MKYQKSKNPKRGNTPNYHGNYAPTTKGRKSNPYKTKKQQEEETDEYCYFNQYFKKSLLDAYRYKGRQFDYLFKELANNPDALQSQSEETINHLKRLGDLMSDPDSDPSTDDSSIPPGYTYWGQFLDHDISAGTDRSHGNTITKDQFDPIPASQVIKDIKNLRSAFFDLDSLYGDKEGPFCNMQHLYDPQDIVKFKIGINDDNPSISGELPNAALGKMRDLPRHGETQGYLYQEQANFKTIAIIGDERNDENTIIGQFHLAMLKFHNKVVDAIRAEKPQLSPRDLFFQARQEVKNHYQWLIVHDFLKRLLNKDIYANILEELNNLKADTIFDEFGEVGENHVFMPLEFSVAAYRFGHTMVRNNYDFNLNFGSGRLNDANDEGLLLSDANFQLLFNFTGKGGQRLAEPNQQAIAAGNTPTRTIDTTLPFNWIIEWERFFDTDINQLGDKQKARKLDTKLAEPLANLVNDVFMPPPSLEEEGSSVAMFNSVMSHLAKRNLLRGYLLSIPTAQAIIKALQEKDVDIQVLSTEELLQGGSEDYITLMNESEFLAKTPLWFYILKEAEIRENGERLGKLGSYIVGRTFAGLLKKETQDSYYQKYVDLLKEDPDHCSYVHQSQWTPATGIIHQLTGSFTGIMDLLRFAEVAIPKQELENIRTQLA